MSRLRCGGWPRGGRRVAEGARSTRHTGGVTDAQDLKCSRFPQIIVGIGTRLEAARVLSEQEATAKRGIVHVGTVPMTRARAYSRTLARVAVTFACAQYYKQRYKQRIIQPCVQNSYGSCRLQLAGLRARLGLDSSPIRLSLTMS